MAHFGRWLEYLPDATDGDETRHLLNRLVAAVTSFDISAGIRLARQYEAADVWFHWVPGAYSIATCVASRDAELAWALVTSSLGLDFDADEDQVQAFMRVIQSVAAAGRMEEAQALAAEVAEHVRRVLDPKRAAAAHEALAQAESGREPGWNWRSVRDEDNALPGMRATVSADHVHFEGRPIDVKELQPLLTGSVDDLARLVRGLASDDWWRVRQEFELRADAALARAGTEALAGFAHALYEAGRLHGYQLPLAIARRYRELGRREDFRDWALKALDEARPWTDPWWGGSLEPFLLLARDDPGWAQELLYRTLADSYKRGYSAQDSLPRLLEALPELGGGPYDELWAEGEAHADDLFAHLPLRQAQLDWLAAWSLDEDPGWPRMVVESIAERLSEPDFANREAAARALLRLLERRRDSTLPVLTERLGTADLTQATLSAAVLHAATVVGDPRHLMPARDALRVAAALGHTALAESALATLTAMDASGVDGAVGPVERAELSRLRGQPTLAVPVSRLILPSRPLTSDQVQRLTFWVPAKEILPHLAELFGLELNEMGVRVLREMDRLGFESPTVEVDTRRLGNRFYNRSAELFEPFEGLHCYYLIHAIAHVVWQLLGELEPGPGIASQAIRLVRQYDPAVLARHLGLPPDQLLHSSVMSKDAWLAYTDCPGPIAQRIPDSDWVALFEQYYLQQAEREEFAFGCVAAVQRGLCGSALPKLVELPDLPMVPLWPQDAGNLTRAEAKSLMPRMPDFRASDGVRSLVTLASGRWRYGGPYQLAALLPGVARGLDLDWAHAASLDMVRGSDLVLRLDEWRAGSSRIGHSRIPISQGARLLIRRDIAGELVKGTGERLVRWMHRSRRTLPPEWRRQEPSAPSERREIEEWSF
jgi:hypothetical protein